MKESNIQKQILAYLNSRSDVHCWRSPNQGVRMQGIGRVKSAVKGLPDISGFYLNSGRAIYLEVKTPKGKLSEDQFRFILKASLAGCLAFCARSLEEVKLVFENESN